jgi:hypothetical protein
VLYCLYNLKQLAFCFSDRTSAAETNDITNIQS